MESFYTLQGEGFHTGKASYFIRLGGCDVGCVWCDVKESWDASMHPMVSLDDIVAQAAAFPARMAVITGGEPLMYDMSLLTHRLKSAGFNLHLETSGAYPMSGTWDWVCVSPKKFKAPLPEVLAVANEFKVVLFHPSDLKWMEQFLPQIPEDCQLFVQPEWSKSETILPLLIDYVKANPRWQMSLQTHKFLNIP